MVERFGTQAALPPGEWQLATEIVYVAGIGYRRQSAVKFAAAVRQAEAIGGDYGVELRRDPRNRFDPHAVRVVGYTLGPFGFRRRYWIGYLPAGYAAELAEVVYATRMPVDGALTEIIISDSGFLEFLVAAIVPAAYPIAAMRDQRLADGSPWLIAERERHLRERQLGSYRYAKYASASAMKRLGRFDDALGLFLVLAWLAAVGARDAEKIEGPLGAIFSDYPVPIEPAVPKEIVRGAKLMGIDLSGLHTRFRAEVAREKVRLAFVSPPQHGDDAWPIVETAVTACWDKVRKWRAPARSS